MSRDKVIVYNGNDGKCRVVIPTLDCALADDAVIAKDVPTAEYAVIENSQLPSKVFREAWTYNHSSSAVDVNLVSAKKICTQILETRYLETEKQNEETTRVARMRGEEPVLASNPAVPYAEIESASSLSVLESLL